MGKDDVGEPIVVEDAQKKETYGTKKKTKKQLVQNDVKKIPII